MSAAVDDSQEPTDGERRDPVTKAFRMLAWMADSDQDRWGVRELARGLEIAPSTAHRTISSLEAAGVLVADPQTAGYRLSLEFLRLASKATEDVPIRHAAIAHMRALVDTTNETAYLGAYDAARRKMMYVETVPSSHPLRYVLPMHEWLPMHAGAGGLGILPFLGNEEIEDILRRNALEPLTERTITDVTELNQELARIRRDGYVLSIGRLIPGAVGIAAPIFGSDDRVIGDIVLALPEVRLPAEIAESLGHDVMVCANRVTVDLGGRVRESEASNRSRSRR